MEVGGVETVRIACWSGPRNISTALMRSWENRPDTVVTDEPLYAHYLATTGTDHPGRDEVLGAQSTDWREVAASLVGPPPGPARLWYQKHMAHHLTDEVERGWIAGLRNVLLIRDPREVLLSLTAVTPDAAVGDTGLEQQVALHHEIAATTGTAPPVIDARDVLADPEGMLRTLCDHLEVPFVEAMLRWPPGKRATDGVWAPHWYATVEASTGFAPYRRRVGTLPDRYRDTLDRCFELYEHLHPHRLTV